MVHASLRMAEGGHSLPPVLNKDVQSRRNLYGNIQIWEHLRSKNTTLSYWRRGLKEILKDYEFDETEGKKCMQFLLSIFRFAILSERNYGEDGSVKIMYNLAPSHLNLVSWRRILIGMNLVLEEPDTNNDIRMIGVSLSRRHIKGETFTEFCHLLELIKECNWQVLHFILDMPEGYPLALLEILEDCKDIGVIRESKQKNVKILYERDMFSMRFLGFYRANPTERVSWNPRNMNPHFTIMSIIYGLCASMLRDNSSLECHSFPHF